MSDFHTYDPLLQNGSGQQTNHKSAPIAPIKTPRTSRSTISGGGLSELSKQLRFLQAKNQSQSVEIDRLERQLRILGDLQGVSVGDLRNALQQACEAEAFGEMQHRVASLRAELEVASHTKSVATSSTSTSVSSAQDAAANAKKMANLELRIGELEEVEESQRAEIESLYSQLVEQQSNATRFETMSDQLRSENENLKTSQQEVSIASEEIQSQERKNLQKDNTFLKNRVLEATMDAKVMSEKIKLLERQRVANEQQFRLRDSQFKARSMVQEETIHDLEQQMSSLYAAFSFVREENARVEETRAALQQNLDLADSTVARQVDVLDNSSNRSTYSSRSESMVSPLKHFHASSSPKSGTTLPPPPSADAVLSGVLLVKTSIGLIRKWKKKHIVLYSALTHHYFDIRDEGGVALHVGRSMVEPYPKYPFGFLLHVGGRAVIAAAAINQEDFDRWMSKLLIATKGHDGSSNIPVGVKPQLPFRDAAVFAVDDDDPKIHRKPSLAELEEFDLQTALDISEKER